MVPAKLQQPWIFFRRFSENRNVVQVFTENRAAVWWAAKWWAILSISIMGRAWRGPCWRTVAAVARPRLIVIVEFEDLVPLHNLLNLFEPSWTESRGYQIHCGGTLRWIHVFQAHTAPGHERCGKIRPGRSLFLIVKRVKHALAFLCIEGREEPIRRTHDARSRRLRSSGCRGQKDRGQYDDAADRPQ